MKNNVNFKKSIFPVFFLAICLLGFSQEKNAPDRFFEAYEEFKEPTISKRRLNYDDIRPLIEKLKQHPGFQVRKVGRSIEGRDLSLISTGEGDIDILLWSQMHGDESTATMAIFDIFNFLTSDMFKTEKEVMLKNVRLHFLPMLNPDGAEAFQRRNSLGIDVNRDARRLQSPEGKTLKRVRDSLEAEFGFNLHDQSKYYNVGTTAKPATISFLAPAYNHEKSVNEVRSDAMKLIVEMNRELQKHMPGQVGRYNDEFEPRAFGDNIQKWGTSAILIESGGLINDPEKQEIRKLNFLAILSGIFSISNENYKQFEIAEYETIPENDNKLFDLKLTGLNYELLGTTYILDLGINNYEIPNGKKTFYYRSQIADQGDLSTNYGYVTKDVTGYRLKPGKIYPETLGRMEDLEKLDLPGILAEGYSYVRVENMPSENHSEYPVQVVKESFEVPLHFAVGSNPTFFLAKDGKPEFAVINGFFLQLDNFDNSVKNGLILR